MRLRDTDAFQRGRTGERLVADLLRRAGWYVIPSYDYTGEEGDKAPRLSGLREGFVVPDLDAARRGTRIWVEVKTKAAATYHRVGRRYEHGIPRRHFLAYRQVQAITGCPVWLFVVEEATGVVLCARLDDLAGRCRVYTGAKMDRGGMVFFPRDAFAVFATVGAVGSDG